MGADLISQRIQESIAVKERLLADAGLQVRIQEVCEQMQAAFEAGGKVLFCGNGGSAADAQHIAAELSGRFYLDRPALYAEALHVNSSYLTAVANDYGYHEVYKRAVEGQGKPGDVVVAISTSGNSGNIIAAMEAGKKKGMFVVGMTGESGGKMAELCDVLLNVPSTDTPRIQECHILIGHILCEMVEAAMF